MFLKILVSWKVLLMPDWAILYGGRFVMSLSSNFILPPSGFVNPLIMLKTVVFPAPFGPINEVIVLFFTSKLQPSTALMPPKLFDTLKNSNKEFLVCSKTPEVFDKL